MTPAALAAVAGTLRTLEEVMRAAVLHGWSLAEVVTQDEYTHDVVLAAPPAWLVFDTT